MNKNIKGLCTINHNTRMRDVAQGIFRMREIGDDDGQYCDYFIPGISINKYDKSENMEKFNCLQQYVGGAIPTLKENIINFLLNNEVSYNKSQCKIYTKELIMCLYRMTDGLFKNKFSEKYKILNYIDITDDKDIFTNQYKIQKYDIDKMNIIKINNNTIKNISKYNKSITSIIKLIIEQYKANMIDVIYDKTQIQEQDQEQEQEQKQEKIKIKENIQINEQISILIEDKNIITILLNRKEGVINPDQYGMGINHYGIDSGSLQEKKILPTILLCYQYDYNDNIKTIYMSSQCFVLLYTHSIRFNKNFEWSLKNIKHVSLLQNGNLNSNRLLLADCNSKQIAELPINSAINMKYMKLKETLSNSQTKLYKKFKLLKFY